MPLNAKQREQLLKPINPKRVQRAQGMSHVAAYDVAAHLTRIFGFGNWEKHITSLDLVSEDGIEKGGRTGWNVTYRCQMTLVIKDPSGEVIWSGDDAATGSSSNLPVKGDAHDFAVKNAVSYALKRCAKDWGDQFGLSLYNKGDMSALVGATLDQAPADTADVERDLPELHPDADESPEPGEPVNQGPHLEPGRHHPEADEDDGDNGDWLEGIDGQAAAGKAEAALREAFKSGAISPAKATRIKAAIQERARELAEQFAAQPADVDEKTAELAAALVAADNLDDLRKAWEEAKTSRKLTSAFMHDGKAVTIQAFTAAKRKRLESREMAGASA